MAAKPGQWDMTGQTVLITGGTGGIGFQTARTLAAAGAHVVITGRDPTRGEDGAAAIRRESGADSATFVPAEHSTVGGTGNWPGRSAPRSPPWTSSSTTSGDSTRPGGRQPTDTRPPWP
jgi:hypothetical protein